MFKDFIEYCSENNVFNNYEDALKAYNKHCQRQSLKNYVDPLKKFYTEYHKAVKDYFRRIKKYRACELYEYDFNDIKSFLCKNHYYGMQVFDCHSMEPTNCVYSKDGVGIFYQSCYEYIDIIGLKPCDFYVLWKAYVRKSNSTYKED